LIPQDLSSENPLLVGSFCRLPVRAQTKLTNSRFSIGCVFRANVWLAVGQ
jgi:hypothetical protein